jgi:hypothetical protein
MLNPASESAQGSNTKGLSGYRLRAETRKMSVLPLPIKSCPTERQVGDSCAVVSFPLQCPQHCPSTSDSKQRAP